MPVRAFGRSPKKPRHPYETVSSAAHPSSRDTAARSIDIAPRAASPRARGGPHPGARAPRRSLQLLRLLLATPLRQTDVRRRAHPSARARSRRARPAHRPAPTAWTATSARSRTAPCPRRSAASGSTRSPASSLGLKARREELTQDEDPAEAATFDRRRHPPAPGRGPTDDPRRRSPDEKGTHASPRRRDPGRRTRPDPADVPAPGRGCSTNPVSTATGFEPRSPPCRSGAVPIRIYVYVFEIPNMTT